MTRGCLTDEQKRKLWIRLLEVDRRANEGTIRFDNTMDSLQHVIEPSLPHIAIVGNYTVEIVKWLSLTQLVRGDIYSDWDREITQEENYVNDYFFGQPQTRTAVLIQLNLPASNKRVVESLRRKGLRSLSGRELLYLANINAHNLKRKLRDMERSLVVIGGHWDMGVEHPWKYLKLEILNNELTPKLKEEPIDGWPTDCLFIGFPITDTEASWPIVS